MKATESDITLTLPDFSLTSLNRLTGHWAKRARLKRRDRELVFHYARIQGLPRATGKRRVWLEVTLLKGKRRLDDDNAWKSILDALVHAGLLVNDSPRWCERGGPVEWHRGPRRQVVVRLEDVAGV